jgi:hypothetical protein
MKIDIKKLEREKDRAIYASGVFSNQEWRIEAEAAVTLLAKRGNPFTTDEVLRLLKEVNVTTHDNRALGAVMNKFHKEGLIKPVGIRKSIWRDAHRRPKTEWSRA